MEKIMIVDDEPVIREFLQDYLSMKGYDTATAANGAEALSAIDAFSADIILLDLNMPVMNGFSFLEALSQKKVLCHVIVMSTLNDRYTRNLVMRLGADAYLNKPFDFRQLDRLIEKKTDAAPPANPESTPCVRM